MSLSLDYIKKLSTLNEGIDIEFKKSTGQLNRGMETLCGMLNGDGGIVVFGIAPDGSVKGQEVGDKTTREIGEALVKFEPAVTIQPQYIPLDDAEGKKLIAFQVFAEQASNKPYQWDGRAYQRYDSVTSVMPRERYIRMLELARGGLKYNWENIVNENLTLDDIEEYWVRNAVRGGVRRGRLDNAALEEDLPSILQRFKVCNGSKICNSAAILFGRNFFDYPQAKVRLARFRGTDKTEFIDNQQAEGNIFQLLDASMKFFFKHLSLSSKMLGLEREDELEVPYRALREGVSNALAHRAWQRESSTIGIAIYDDKIVIENAGRFPYKVSPAELMADEENMHIQTSEPTNPEIAQVMYYSGLIEKWGRGLSLMVSECRRVGLPDPQFIEKHENVWLIFKRPEYGRDTVGIRSGHGLSQVEVQSELSQGQSQGQSRAKVGPKSGGEGLKYIPSNNNIARLILSLGLNTLSARELREEMGYKSTQRFNVNYLQPAITDGAIKRENSLGARASNQRYLLTDKGLAYYHLHKDDK